MRKRFFIIFTILIITAGGIFGYVYSVNVENRRLLIKTREEMGLLDIQHSTSIDALHYVSGDLVYLGGNVRDTIAEEESAAAKKKLTDRFTSFLEQRKDYSKARYIDKTGREIIRVDYAEGGIKIIPESRLQQKANRYYFRKTISLDKDRIFISPMDLNKEYGKISVPIKPVIRFAMPVFSTKGRKQGIIVLTYHANRLLDRTRYEVAHMSKGEFSMLNPEGYWLIAPKSEDEWGFMFDDRKNKNFANIYPVAWKTISEQERGWVQTDNGMFIFTTVHPLQNGSFRKNASGELLESLVKPSNGKQYMWKLVSHISPAMMESITERLRNRFIWSYLIFIIILGVIGESLFFLYKRRRVAEQAKHEIEEHYRHLVDNMPDGVVVHRGGKIQFANRAAVAIVGGKSEQEFIDKKVIQLVHPAYQQKVLERMARAIKGETADLTEEKLVRLNGEPFDAEVVGIPVMFEGEKSVMAIFRDITARKKAEREIQKKASFIDNMLRSSVDMAIAATDLDFHITYYNPMAEKLFGYTSQEAIGKTVQEIHTKEKVEPERFERAIKIVRETGEYHYTVEKEVEDGIQYIESRVSGIWDENGELTGFLLMSRDVTERKRAEEAVARLAVGIEQAGEAIMITDPDGNIIYVNPEFEKITGYSREETIGKNPRVLKSGKQGDAFYKNLWAVITAGNVWKGSFINRKKDGSLFDEEATISPVFDDKGKIINYVAVKRDVTEKAMLERARKHFTTITSHELKTPQVKLQLGIERLKSLQQGEFDRERFDDALKALKDTEHDFNHIITGALLLAKLSEPVTSSMMEENYIFSHIESAVLKTRSLAAQEKRDVEIELDLSGFPARTAVYGNRNMISRAIEEILSNAVKYTPDGKKVTVTARAEEKKAVILIFDEGPGVPEAKKKAALDAYSSLESTLHHSTGRYIYEGGGLGLGLTLTRLIMDHHHGRMEICSGGSQPGTTVVLSFPTASK